MLAAGVALVESAGDALVQRLLPQFESYLEPSAASRLGLAEARYDLVREGVVVLLGMMAGHLAPADDKVRQQQGAAGAGRMLGAAVKGACIGSRVCYLLCSESCLLCFTPAGVHSSQLHISCTSFSLSIHLKLAPSASCLLLLYCCSVCLLWACCWTC
jgi:hypothetical protein